MAAIESIMPTTLNYTSSIARAGRSFPPALSETSVQRQGIADGGLNIGFDFKNISRHEIANLVKLGELEMNHFIMALPEGGIDLTQDTKSQMDKEWGKKVNLVQMIEDKIQYRKSENLSTEYYDEVLASIYALQEKSRNQSVNVFV